LDVTGPDGKIQHAEMMHQGETVIMFGPEGAMGGTCKSPVTSGVEVPVTLYVYCPDVDALSQQAKQAGAVVVSEPQDMFWGDRMTQLKDSESYVWNFAMHNREAIAHD